jgi:hypothetical protein
MRENTRENLDINVKNIVKEGLLYQIRNKVSQKVIPIPT